MYDAIIVGARCAGSPTAMLLARAGCRVLLVDRAKFPSDTLSTHFVWPGGAARLHSWGLLDAVRRSNCPPVTTISMDVGAFTLRGSPPPAANGVREGFGPRRTVLDKMLLDAAAASGAEVREEFAVQEILFEEECVSGIRGQARGGTAVTEQGRIVVGADGLHSMVARAVAAAEYNAQPPHACWYYTYWEGLPMTGAELYLRPGRSFVAFPTNDGLTLVVVGWKHAEFPAFRAAIERNYLETLDLAPAFAARVAQSKRAERFYGTSDVPNLFRRPYGPGWALVGDAGYHKDPVTAQGISDAFRDAEQLSRAICDGLSGKRTFSDALADYERLRNEAVLPEYESTCQRARMEPPPPDVARLLEALRGNQPQIDRFFGTDAGTVPFADFFSEENIGRIIGHAGAAGGSGG